MIQENEYNNLLKKFNKLLPQDQSILKQIYTHGLDYTLKDISGFARSSKEYALYNSLAKEFLPLFPHSKYVPNAVRGRSPPPPPPPQPSARKKKRK
jgi:hypothetical protein